MLSLIVTTAVGILISVFAVITMRGNLSLLHSYHYKRVKEEDKKVFGKYVGIGLLIIGIGITLMGVSLFLFEKAHIAICEPIGYAIMILALVIGLPFMFIPMLKYNKGIF